VFLVGGVLCVRRFRPPLGWIALVLGVLALLAFGGYLLLASMLAGAIKG
jgi:hypothetical protein